jgi:hypothetical protein
MSKTVSLRPPEETAGRLEAIAQELGLSVSEVRAMMVEEWLRQDEFPEIEFRTFNRERLACLKGLIRIWKIIMVAEDYEFDIEKTAYHFQFPPHRIEAAFNYYRTYPEETNRIIAENRAVTFEDLKRMLPHIERFTVEREPDDVGTPG